MSSAMTFRTISLCVVTIVTVTYGVFSAKRQELSRDPIYSRFEEYDRNMNEDQVRDRLDALAQHLKMNPSLRAFVISYGGKQSCHNEASLRARLVTRYLSKMKGIPRHRFSTLNGGYPDNWVVELWVGSASAVPPPSMRTIDKRRVTIRKNCGVTPIKVSQ